jgi:hypothetical protein
LILNNPLATWTSQHRLHIYEDGCTTVFNRISWKWQNGYGDG